MTYDIMTYDVMIWEVWDNLTFYFAQLYFTHIFGLGRTVPHSDCLIDPKNIHFPKDLWVQKFFTSYCLVHFAAFVITVFIIIEDTYIKCEKKLQDVKLTATFIQNE